MNIKELVEQERETSEANPDAPLTSDSAVSRGHPRSRTLQVRLNPKEYERIIEEADRRQMPASTYARTVLLASVSSQAAEFSAAVERLREDADVLEASMVELIAKSKR